MPQDFINCVKNGGKVITKKLKNNEYVKVCYDKEGNSYSGATKKSKKQIDKAKAEARRFKNSKDLAKSLLELKEHINNNFHN